MKKIWPYIVSYFCILYSFSSPTAAASSTGFFWSDSSRTYINTRFEQKNTWMTCCCHKIKKLFHDQRNYCKPQEDDSSGKKWTYI